VTTAATLRTVRTIRHTWIPLVDGCRLSARIWLPEDAEEHPVPAILEYLPYRKNDGTALRDSTRHPYFAAHGYASVRVDLRGSGDSDGILMGEYLLQEQDDALEVLAWLAEQPWCTGAVGMIGISWGGFNGLQVAARRPPELKAVVSLGTTDDRYLDDVHYLGGCVHQAMLGWASQMLAFNARPPDPESVGDAWREKWLDRLERTPPFVEDWLSHQHYDEFWQHGSVREDYDAIECPVYLVSGWADWYRNPVASLLENLRVPRKALLGPWGHVYPDVGVWGPAIGFLDECVRWWDQWLKGIETGIMDEPMLRVWIPEPVGEDGTRSSEGRWVAEDAWPAEEPRASTYALNRLGLGGQPEPEAELVVRSPESTGVDTGGWGLLVDQRAEDGRSVTFTSEPLDARLEILGRPYVTLALAADRPNALVAVRLCDVAPDGTSTLVTRGALNLTHRQSHEQPRPVVPGERFPVRVRLDLIAHSFGPGHRIRVAVSSSYWPRLWPSPDPAALTLFSGPASMLELPVRSPRPEDDEASPLPEPVAVTPARVEVVRNQQRQWVEREVATGRATLKSRGGRDGWRYLDDGGLFYFPQARNEFSIVDGDPLSATVRCENTIVVERGDWRTRVETHSTMTSTRAAFLVTNELEAFEGELRIFAKAWTFEVPRRLV
jgi:putative CocE/NonD family hydrolase